MALAKAVIDRDNEDTFVKRLEKKITDNITSQLSINAIDLQLEKAFNSAERLREIHYRITHINPSPTDIDVHTTKYEDLDDRISQAIVDLRDLRAQLIPASSGTRPPPQQHVKLPEIHLPTFDGKYEDWPSFEDLFLATIDKNLSLAPAQKLQYLKSCTTGEPNALIRSFTITDRHYVEAWTLLQNRYKNLREITHSLIKKLLYQPKCKCSGAAELQSLLNTTTECIRSLSVQGCPTDYWDDFVVVIIVDKLDPEAKSEWAKTLVGTAPPTYAELTTFLENHVRALTAKGNVSAPPRQPLQHNPNFRHGRIARVHHAAPAYQGCPFCKQSHRLPQCPQFHSATLQERSQFINSISACSNCLNTSHHKKDCNSKYTCRKCQMQHHTLLHRDNGTSSQVFHSEHHKVQNQRQQGKQPATSNVTRSHHSSNSSIESTQVLLKTVIVLIQDASGNKQQCRALLDDGSESSFITEACAKSLSLQREPTDVRIAGVSSTDVAHAKWKVNIRLLSAVYNAHADVEALVLKRVTGNLPRTTCNPSWDHLNDLPLADPHFHQPGKIDLLLGADVVASIMRSGLRRGPPSSPTASHTIFGWVLSGRIATQQQRIVRSFHTSIRLDEIARQIWQESQPPRATTFTQAERECESHFASNVLRTPEGRYQVRLPFHVNPDKPNISNIGNTRKLAESRLLSLERRFQRHATHHESYKAFMKEYLELGHMQLAPASSKYTPTYIPHHFVLKDDSTTTKLRVVFDGSMKSTNGVSLNSTMMVGPTIQDDLFSILLRFRINPIALKGDIAKMYRQFSIHPDDQDHQRILWREDPTQPIEEYQLTTVTYGTSSAPYLATRCLQQLAKDEMPRFPEAAAILLRDMYVDDLLSGTHNVPSSIALLKQLQQITAAGGMSIRKLCSNSTDVMDSIPAELREDVSALSFDHDDYVKTLGIVWQPGPDTFTFHTACNPIAATKRTLLSEIAKVFDPLGWLSPLTISAKILFQSSWKEQQDWDDTLSSVQQQEWGEYQQQLHLLSQLSIPRYIPHNGNQLQLTGFSDASEKAYAACIYITYESGSHLIAAKTKVAPLKQMSLPRLELCAALLLCELLESTTQSLNRGYEIKCYTDSMIVLKWISSTSRRWKTFVANRVAAIQEIVPTESWSHVVGTENPADLPSRGIKAEELLQSTLWWNGPSWLNGQANPLKSNDHLDMKEVLQEERSKQVTVHHATGSEPFIITYVQQFSSFEKLTTSTAILQQFIRYLHPKSRRVVSKFISPADRLAARQSIIAATQAVYFKDDIANLKKDGFVKPNSKLASLNPFIQDSIIRVGGRLQKASFQSGFKHPIILSKRSYLTELIVRHNHIANLHSSIQLTLAAIFNQYWIIGARSYVRLIIRKCIICRRVKATTMQQQMGQLPHARITQYRPFLHAGVDFAGPYSIKVSTRRNAALQKYYFAVFVCMSTKALHLEPVSSLSTEGFIAAFRRFASRRGLCSHLYCDCGTNFKGTERVLREQLTTLEDQLQRKLSELGTAFHFNPPAAPNQGGLWEACVKQVKHHLRRVVGASTLTLEHFSTLLCQIEGCLNSRPLIPRSPDPSDMQPLTPGHFLIGCPILAIPDPDLTLLPPNRLDQWQNIQQMTQQFWRRWQNEYLMTLQQRAKWRRPMENAKVGDLVLIAAENLPTCQWKTGRITEVHPGADNLVRSVTVRIILQLNPLKYSEIMRPITKIAIILPNAEEE